MDKVLNAGIDGFKCDGTDPYILEYQLTTGALGYQNKSLTYKEYADYYYGDFFNYTREVYISAICLVFVFVGEYHVFMYACRFEAMLV